MNRIKELRTKHGITQSNLAKYLNIAQNTLSYWEQDKYDIDNDSLQKLAVYFNTTTDYILGISNSYINKNKENLTNEEEALQILVKERNLSKKDLEYLKDTLNLLEVKNKAKELNERKLSNKIKNKLT